MKNKVTEKLTVKAGSPVGSNTEGLRCHGRCIKGLLT